MSKAFDRISELMASKTCTLDELVAAPNIKQSIGFHQKGVIQFLKDNLFELIEKAFNGDQKLDVRVQNKYDIVLREFAERCPKDIASCRFFLAYLDAISDAVINKKPLIIPRRPETEKNDNEPQKEEESEKSDKKETNEVNSADESVKQEGKNDADGEITGEKCEENENSPKEEEKNEISKENDKKVGKMIIIPPSIHQLKANTLISAAEAFLGVIKSQNDQAIYVFVSRPNFFMAMIHYIECNAIFDILKTLSEYNTRSLKYLLEKIKASDRIFAYIQESKSTRSLTILSNIVNLVTINSKLVKELSVKEKLQWLIDLPFKSTDSVLNCECFKLLFSLFMQVSYDEYSDIDTDSEYDYYDESPSELAEFFKDAFDKIVEFCVDEERPFKCDKGTAVALAAKLITYVKTKKELFEKLLDFMFEETLRHPTVSMIHNNFLLVFDACKSVDVSLDDFDKRLDVKVRIAKLFQKKREMLANYWCHLHIIADSFASKDALGSIGELDNTETDISDAEDEIAIETNDADIKIVLPDENEGPGPNDYVIGVKDNGEFFQGKFKDFNNEQDTANNNSIVGSNNSDQQALELDDSLKSESIDSDGFSSYQQTEAVQSNIIIGSIPTFTAQPSPISQLPPRPLAPASSLPSIMAPPPLPNLNLLPPPIPTIGMIPPPIPSFNSIAQNDPKKNSFDESKQSPKKTTIVERKIPVFSEEEYSAEPWKCFIASYFKEMTDIMAEDFGGKVPGFSDDDLLGFSTDDDDDFA